MTTTNTHNDDELIDALEVAAKDIALGSSIQEIALATERFKSAKEALCQALATARKEGAEAEREKIIGELLKEDKRQVATNQYDHYAGVGILGNFAKTLKATTSNQ